MRHLCFHKVPALGYYVNSFMKEFAIHLKNAREKEKLTQKELADELAVSLNTYKKWECRGDGHRTPDIAVIIRIADILKITLDELVGR